MNKRILCLIGLAAVGAFGKTATTTNVSASPSTSFLGQQVTITATVNPVPTGNATFYDGATVLGVVALAGGTAQFQTKLLSAGPHAVTAYYSGDGTYAPSTSATPFPLLVQAKPANTLLSAVNYPAGTYPVAVAVGKFGSGGKSDLAVVNWGSNNVSVLLGNGDGTVQTAVNYPVGVNPHSVAVGDFDGDGHSDLAVANMGGNVSILLGKANGTFKVAVNYNAGPIPYSVAVGDFDGDGKADLAVANNNLGVSILLGNGDGTFKAPLSITGVAPSSIAVGDFNGDHKADLAVANMNLGTVSVLLGNGDQNATFQAPLTHVAGPRPFAIAVGDFNSDGAQDLAVTDYGFGGSVWLFTGLSDGTFDGVLAYTVGSVPTSVAVGDFNGDGHTDVAVASSYSNIVSVLLGNPVQPGFFQPPVNFKAGTLPCSLAVGEFNGDRITDLAVANYFGNVSILLGANLSISSVSGGGQSAKINTVFANNLIAVVKDAMNNPVSGVPVTFTAPGSGASAIFQGNVTSKTVLTDGSGQATSPAFKANGMVGSYSITASISPTFGPTVSTSFSLINTR